MDYCPECGTRVRPDVTYCHGCGKDLREYREWTASAEVDAGDGATAGTDADPDDSGPQGPGRSSGGEVTEDPRDGTDPGADAPPRRESGRDRSGNADRGPDPRADDPAGSPPSASGRGAAGDREYDTARQAGSQGGGASSAARPGQQVDGATVPGEGQPADTHDQPSAGPGERSPAAAGEPAVDTGPSLSDRVTALPLKRSAAVGAGLALVSYLATYLAFAVDALVVNGGDHSLGPSNLLPLTDVTAGSSQQMWELVAWLFYAGHNVPIERPAAGGSEVVDVLGAGYWTQFTVPRLVTPALYTLVPLAVLVAGGAVYVRYHEDATLDGGRTDLALLGASVLVGYAAVAAAGSTLVGVAEGGVSTGPPLIDAALWTGAVAGGAGAVGGVASRRFGGDAAGDGAGGDGAVDGDEAGDRDAAGDVDTSPSADDPAPTDDSGRASAGGGAHTTDDAPSDDREAATDATGPVDAVPADDER